MLINNKVQIRDNSSDLNEIRDDLRIKKLLERRDWIDKNKLRSTWGDVGGFKYGHAGGMGLGDDQGSLERLVSVGDQAAVVHVLPQNEEEERLVREYKGIGIHPLFKGMLPSFEKGALSDQINFAEDYAALLDYSLTEIYPYETIVGEYHWQLGEVRGVNSPNQKEVEELKKIARRYGADGTSATHTCADLGIGFSLGWGGILGKIRDNLAKFEKDGKDKEVTYLKAAEIVCKSIMRFISKHSARAYQLADQEKDQAQKENYLRIAETCGRIASEPPSSFYEAVQWLWFFIMVERMLAGGNGYGHMDWLLNPFYQKDLREGRINRRQAVEIVAELFIKYKTYYSLGGRNEKGEDATNEVSWIFLDAYDVVGGTNEFGVLWHADIDRDFFRHACEVLMRNGTGSPALVNYDTMRKSFIYYGVDPKDAWKVAYSGCYWYCIPGMVYNGDDMSAVNTILCFKNAFDIACEKGINSYEELWDLFSVQLDLAAKSLKALVDARYKVQPQIWPEIVASLLCHGPVENGRDITDSGVKYNMTTVHLSSLANVADSFAAIKKAVFEDKKLTLGEIKKAIDANYEGNEEVRQMLLNVPKYGNDEDYVDEIAVRVVEQFKKTFADLRNCKGGRFRIAVYNWTGSPYGPEIIGATPDGRKKEAPLSQGPNPMHGRNKIGLTATINSVSRLGFDELAGGTLQIEVDPLFLRLEDPASFIESIANSYFQKSGNQIFVNIVSRDTLIDAMEHPEEHEDLVIRVTGYSVHFVQLDKAIQQEIVARTRYS